MHNTLLYLTKISLLILLPRGFSYKTETKENIELKMMKACERYIADYSPLYNINGDTVNVARFNIVPDNINNYLINCARTNNFKPLKFSAALIIRQHREYLIRNNQEYMLMDALIQKNGFIVLIRQAMKMGNVNDNFTDMNYFPLFSGEACKWINENKELISDLKFVEKQKTKRLE